MKGGRQTITLHPLPMQFLFPSALSRLLLFSGLLLSIVTAAEQKPPNVIIVLSDDQGYGDLSCHGHPVLKTPNLDRLHDETIRLTDFHVSPMCTPSRGQLLTGVDALRNGAIAVQGGMTSIHPGIPTMPEIFKAGGYRTAMFGKWHLGDNYPNRPMDRGFEQALWFRGFGVNSSQEFDNDNFEIRYQRGTKVEQAKGRYCTDFWFDEAMSWMRQRQKAGEPFFCYLPLNAVHAPWSVDDVYSQPYARQKGTLPAYLGMIANVDSNMGRLEQMLAESGLRENTILIFLSDNGRANLAAFRDFKFNAGMRGFKKDFYEGGHRVPCFVRWPAGKLRQPGDVNVATQVQDLLPTLISLCGLPQPANARFDGSDISAILRGADVGPQDRMLVVQYGFPTPKKDKACVIWNQWRLVHNKELYDIHADPAQKHDIAAQNPDVAAKMLAHYKQWWASVEPKLGTYDPIPLGAAQENPVLLCGADWNKPVGGSIDVSESRADARGAQWAIRVEQAGDYLVELRRWPFHTEEPLDSTGPSKTVHGIVIKAGNAFAITAAKLLVGKEEYSAKAAEKGGKGISFKLKLPAGVTTLQGWFQDEAGKDLCGAFYAQVQRM